MTWLAPGYLVAALAAAAGVVMLHFFARRVPRPFALPTARFVPDAAVRAPSLARRPTDPLLLALRVLALLLAGAALARPVRAPQRQPLLRVVVADSAGAASAAEVLDSARARAVAGDTILVGPAGRGAGSLAPLLIGARRAAAVLAPRAESLELVIVSAFTTASWDAATAPVREQWPGRAALVRVTAAPAGEPPAIQLSGASGGGDPLRATVALLGARRGTPVRLLRSAATAADSAWAQGGGTVVVWPERPGDAWPGGSGDTSGAVIAGDAVAVAPFARTAQLVADDSSVVVARWADGVPAAIERSHGAGCVRAVAVQVSGAGDLVLRAGFRAVVDRLTAPCGGALTTAPLGEGQLALLAGGGGAALAPARGFVLAAPRRAGLTGWLLGAAVLLLIGELALRGRRQA